jgi:aminoglycoside phosphotransferase
MQAKPDSIRRANLLGYCVEKKFTSRKNEVFLVKRAGEESKGYLVYKKYSRPDRMDTEMEMLRYLSSKDVPVPQICGSGDDYILLEYLDGTLLLDRFCSLEEVHGSETTSLADSTRRFVFHLCCWQIDSIVIRWKRLVCQYWTNNHGNLVS